MYTVGRLAKRHGLSRSTLLYYDRIGLFSPGGHAKGEYRHYTESDDTRLAKICEYRKAGIALKDIGRILDDQAGTGLAQALENRLAELNKEMLALKDQQQLVARLLGRTDLLGDHEAMNKATWVSLLQSAGFTENDMRRWHVQFERSAPDKHETFLRQLRIPESEITAIRSLAAAPQQILNIHKESGKFMEVFFKIYEGLDREGPGSFAMTKRAYEMCGAPDAPSILELGCGSGGVTRELVKLSNGPIMSSDVHQPFLDRAVERMQTAGASDRVTVEKRDMSDLDYEPESFDIIWCEGAAYIMGVDKAFQYWKQFLKPGGHLVISDAVWLTDNPPQEVKEFWAEGYPVMRTAEANIAAAESFGYTSLGHFIIDDQCWGDFYTDVERRLDEVEETYKDNPDGQAIIALARKENDLYYKHPNMYGYAMHVFRK